MKKSEALYRAERAWISLVRSRNYILVERSFVQLNGSSERRASNVTYFHRVGLLVTEMAWAITM